jgi:hypothetical protein
MKRSDEMRSFKTCIVYTPPNMINVIKSIRIRWAGHVAFMAKLRNVYSISVRNPKGKGFWGLDVEERIMLKCTLKETGHDGVNWIQMAPVTAHMRALENTVMNTWFDKRWGPNVAVKQ